MARPYKNRKICNPPQMQGFKPYGIAAGATEYVILRYDEFEAMKLVNYDNLRQEVAAEKMDVSRPTLTRIYNSALKKIAQSFVEGKSIIIKGGNFEFEKDWYKCKKCFKLIEGLENHVKCSECECFGNEELMKFNKQNIN